MDGFTPSFVLQLLLAIGSAGAVYGAVRADLNNMARSLDEERRLREQHAQETDRTHQDLRGEIQTVKVQQARLEGKQIMATEILDAVRNTR